MDLLSGVELTGRIVEKAKSLGASLAGTASLESLRQSPSHLIYPKIGLDLETPWQQARPDGKSRHVAWPADALSAVVIGVEHNAAQPELDWWDGKGTPGNRILIRINRELSQWLEAALSIKTYKLPYFIEKGGIFLKDAAMMAGLGSLGKNNLLITPQYGPRIRFRALLINQEAQSTGPLDFKPCHECAQPCRKACPIKAFDQKVYEADALGQSALPGLDGGYDRVTCNRKMAKDIEDAVNAIPADGQEHQEVRQAIDRFEEAAKGALQTPAKLPYRVKYCRRCELACPWGKPGRGRERQ
jgi:epoxyqueuosine reductase